MAEQAVDRVAKTKIIFKKPRERGYVTLGNVITMVWLEKHYLNYHFFDGRKID